MLCVRYAPSPPWLSGTHTVVLGLMVTVRCWTSRISCLPCPLAGWMLQLQPHRLVMVPWSSICDPVDWLRGIFVVFPHRGSWRLSVGSWVVLAGTLALTL